MRNKRKSVLLVITLITLIILVFGATYAYFQAQTGLGASANINVTANTTDSLMFSVGNDLGLNITQENFGEGAGNQSDVTTAKATLIANNKTNVASYNYYLYLLVRKNEFVYTTEEETPEILLQITKPDGTILTNLEGLNYVTVGDTSGFDITTRNGLITIANSKLIEVLESNTEHKTEEEWRVEIVFVNLDSNQQENTGKQFSAQLKIQQEEIILTIADVCQNENMAQCIKDNYTLDRSVYYHDETLANGAEDNSYRYAGPHDKVNNFVCFGTDAENCPNDNLYRIIGVFEDKVKLIKYDYSAKEQLGVDGDYWGETDPDARYYKGSQSQISIYYWNNANGSNSKSNWNESRLNIVNLNGTYLNNLGSVWTDKIATITWNVGGMSDSNGRLLNAKTAYDYEVGANKINKTYEAKVGLMYLSEYYYGALPIHWTKPGYDSSSSKDYRTAVNDNWMYMGYVEWTISLYTDITKRVFAVYWNGLVSDISVYNYSNAIRPTFSLVPSVELTGGSGTKSDPYRIS